MSRSALSRALTLGVACSLSLSPRAEAQPRAFATSSADCRAEGAKKLETLLEISVLHGTHDKRESDPRISAMPELREGPFASYASYALLSRVSLSLSRGAKRQLKLPNGRLLETLLEEILADGSSRLVARINRAGGSEFLPLLEVKARPGQAFIVAGQSYKRGVLVLVIKVVR